jgi:hypothetical protein
VDPIDLWSWLRKPASAADGLKPWGRPEAGFAVVQWSAGLAIGIVVFVFAANLVLVQYTGGALQAATDLGARAGAVIGGTPDACRRRAEEVLRGEGGLLRGPYGRLVSVTCREVGERIEATASATLPWWLDVLPPVSLEITSEAVAERVEDSPPSNGLSR